MSPQVDAGMHRGTPWTGAQNRFFPERLPHTPLAHIPAHMLDYTPKTP